jgi:hypothetical protein
MKKDDVFKGNKVIKKQKPTVNRRIEGLPQSARKKHLNWWFTRHSKDRNNVYPAVDGMLLTQPSKQQQQLFGGERIVRFRAKFPHYSQMLLLWFLVLLSYFKNLWLFLQQFSGLGNFSASFFTLFRKVTRLVDASPLVQKYHYKKNNHPTTAFRLLWVPSTGRSC